MEVCIKLVTIGLLMILSMICTAMDTGGAYKITKIFTWNSFTNGTVVIQLENTNATCPGGYWFQDAANSGPKNLLAVALSAYHAKTSVMIYADESSSFAGLGPKTCEVKLIVLAG